MKSSRIAGLTGSVVVLLFSSTGWASDNGPATLQDIHAVLVQAAGEPDAPPAPAQQRALLEQALKMIRHAPSDAHRSLRGATRELEAALEEISKGGDDANRRARTDILDADDVVRQAMA